MTPAQQEAKRRAEVMLAFAEGKEIECDRGGAERYMPNERPTWDWSCNDYRVKPTPATRPWGPDDVPPLCWVRSTARPKMRYGMNQFDNEGLFLHPDSFIAWETLRSEYEYSTDLRTWRRCEVAV